MIPLTNIMERGAIPSWKKREKKNMENASME
jgi:hypothetical protein